MLPSNKNIKAYFIAAVVITLALLLLMLKLRPDKAEAFKLADDYEFTPWIGDKQQWLNKVGQNEITDISIAEEMKRIEISRPATKVVDANEFVVEEVETVRFHIVDEYDTLSEISKTYYGTSRKWRNIFEANKDKIADPDVLEQGVKLIIPE